jgi:DNA-binding transcriptional MerR regulator
MTNDDLFSIGELAQRSGVPVKTIRHYADEGVLPPSATSEAGYRFYSAADARRLGVVRSLRALGFSLPAIASMLDGTRDPPTSPNYSSTWSRRSYGRSNGSARSCAERRRCATAIAYSNSSTPRMLRHRLARRSERTSWSAGSRGRSRRLRTTRGARRFARWS